MIDMLIWWSNHWKVPILATKLIINPSREIGLLVNDCLVTELLLEWVVAWVKWCDFSWSDHPRVGPADFTSLYKDFFSILNNHYILLMKGLMDPFYNFPSLSPTVKPYLSLMHNYNSFPFKLFETFNSSLGLSNHFLIFWYFDTWYCDICTFLVIIQHNLNVLVLVSCVSSYCYHIYNSFF